jgi:RNA polymerase sigma factor (sigma-70 family)
MRELFVLYAPLLRDQARKMSIPSGEHDELVTTLLDDVVLHLIEAQSPPRELARYLVSSLRNRARNRHRDWIRQKTTDASAYAEYGDARQKIVAECHSEYGLRASQSSDADSEIPLRSAIAKLAAKSASELSQEEIVIIVGIGRHVPLRDLAEQLGMSYGAARVRLSRLRERFTRLALQYVATLENVEKREIERFFRRADIPIDPIAERSRSDNSRSISHSNSAQEKQDDDI